jgi:hypothetical protein
MSYARYDELPKVLYMSLTDLPTYTFHVNPSNIKRSVTFDQPTQNTILFDVEKQDDEPVFSFQIASDTIRPSTNNTSISLIR